MIAAHAEGLGVRLKALPLGDESELLAARSSSSSKGDAGDEPSTADALGGLDSRSCHESAQRDRRTAARRRYTRALDGSIAAWPEARLRWLRSRPDLTDAGRRSSAPADRLLFLDGRLHAEMMSEVRFDADPAANGRGIPG